MCMSQRQNRKEQNPMKHAKKSLRLLLLMALLVLLPVMQAMAADNAPDKVEKLEAKAISETSVQLTWSKVSKATGYYVYQVDATTGKEKKIKKTTKPEYTIKKLAVGVEYTYRVYAYKTVGDTNYKSAEPSPSVTVKTSVITPGKPAKLKIEKYGDQTIKLKWNKVKDATGYYVYKYDTKKEEYVKLATVKKGETYTAKKLTGGTKYTFKVQAYRTVQKVTATGKMSKEVSGTAISAKSAAKSVKGRYFNATLRYNTTVKTSDGKSVKLKKGTKVTATKRSSKNLTIIMKNGTKATIKGKRLRYNSLKVYSTDYTKFTKESFVNQKGYSSKTKYLIWISQHTARVNVFKGSKGKWKLVRTAKCVIGKDGKTPTGTFRLLFKDHAYGGVRIYFTWNNVKKWGNSLHRRVNSTTWGAWSSGCIRLSDADLNYINKYCALGTTVVSK